MISEKFITTWNVTSHNGNENTLNCANKRLEWYKRYMKSLFHLGIPSFAEFMTTMRGESEHQQRKVHDHIYL